MRHIMYLKICHACNFYGIQETFLGNFRDTETVARKFYGKFLN